MRNFKTLLFALIASTIALQSCSSDDSPTNNENEIVYKNGIFTLSEGAMGSNNAEVTFYKNGTATQNIFKTANPTLNLGNVATDLFFENDKAYIVVNLSNKIEVVQSDNFKTIATITNNLNNPRYIASDNQNIYVTNWGDAANANDDYISVFKKADLSFVKKIDVAEGPDKILVKNNQLIIAHSGGWSNGNSVSFYNLSSNTLKNIVVGDVPSAIVEDNGTAYVLCSGITWGGTPSAGKIVKLNIDTQSITQTINFNEGENPRFLVKDNNQLYYTLNNKVFGTTKQATTLPNTPLFTSDASYIYSFNVLNNIIYIGDAKDFASNGDVKYYSTAGSLLGSFTTGIGPNIITHN